MNGAAARPRRQRPLTLLGMAGPLVIATGSGDLSTFTPRPSAWLTTDGQRMFVLTPAGPAEPIAALDRDLAEAAALYEKWSHRALDSLMATRTAPLTCRRFIGECVIIRYTADKNIPGLRGVREYEHYFPAPDQPRVYALGNHQYEIDSGGWRITEQGIA